MEILPGTGALFNPKIQNIPARASCLSAPKYGYDIVLALTQENINTGLKEYLSNPNHAVHRLCFVSGSTVGDPVKPLALQDFKGRAAGVDPFSINHITDPNVKTIVSAGFVCGVEMQIGLPFGVEPRHLPFEVVTLGNSAHNVTFTMYCSHIRVIEYVPPQEPATEGVWNTWNQPIGKAWYAQSSVDLTQGLTDLNTPYFSNNVAQRTAIQTQLNGLGGSNFSLQHLIFDLEKHKPLNTTILDGIPPQTVAADTLRKHFTYIWADNAKQFDVPPVWVAAKAQSSGKVFNLTSIEPMVHTPLIPNGSPPTQNSGSNQANLTTLDYLCMVDNHPPRPVSPFTWNWVDAGDKDSAGGVIAIKRDIVIEYVKSQMSKYLDRMNLKPRGGDSWIVLVGNDDSSRLMETMPNGPSILQGSVWSSENYPADSSTWSLAVDATYKFNYLVRLQGSTVVISQDVSFDVTMPPHGPDNMQNSPLIFSGNTSVYGVSVDALGHLQILLQDSTPHFPGGVSTDSELRQQGYDSTQARFIQSITRGLNAMIEPITFASERIHSLPATIFPGGKTFVYKNATFSDNQDLICSIQYADPPTMSGAPQMSRMMVASSKHAESRSSMPSQGSGDMSVVPSRITWSSELMQNYVQGDLLSLQSKFEALQTDEGHTLLFAVNPAGSLTVVHEIGEATKQGSATVSGWNITDLSSVIAPGTQVSCFGAGQSFSDGTINLAAAVKSGNTSTLYLSLGNSMSDLSWITQPQWKSYPFDALNQTMSDVTIVGLLFAETDDKQLIIADIDQSTDSAVTNIARYHIDPSPKHGNSWKSVDLPVDVGSGDYISCQGRKLEGIVDGIYTSGTLNKQPVLVYQPVKNVFDSGPALSVNLNIPNGTTTSAIAAARDWGDSFSETYGTTALFVVSDCTLYCFTAQNQGEGATAAALLTNSLFGQTKQIIAMTHDGITTIWGLNSKNIVYYVSCPTKDYLTASAWSTPMPVATDVQNFTAYSNQVDGGNTIFLAGSSTLKKLVQSTSESKMWKTQDLYIVASKEPQAHPIKSYTTTIQVNGPADPISIRTQSRSSLYINGSYYVIGPHWVQVKPDPSGLVTIIEPTENINSTTLAVKLGQEMVLINPMEKSFGKLTSLNTPESLRNASVPSQTVAGGVIGTPSSAPLINSSTSNDDIAAVATNLGSLQTSYKSISQPAPATNGTAAPADASFSIFDDISDGLSDIGNAVATAAGDLYRAVKTIGDAIVNGIHKLADGVWHFVATIGGQIYKAALTTVDAVVGAVEWVFHAVETVVEDVIKFIEMLLEWGDITRTKNVMSKMVSLSLQNIQDEMSDAQEAFDTTISAIESKVDTLTGIDWPLPQLSKTTAGSGGNPHQGQTSGSMLFAHHFQNQASNITVAGGTSADEASDLLSDLITALSKEETVLSDVISQLKEIATKFSSLTPAEILKNVIGIITNAILSSIQTVVDALFAALRQVGVLTTSLLNSNIHIPIISDILNAIGISDITFLDLFCWIGAVAYTVVYKIANGDAPFPNNSSTTAITDAQDWNDLVVHFRPAASTIAFDNGNGSGSNTSLTSQQISAYSALHGVGAILALCRCIVQPLAMTNLSSSLLRGLSVGLTMFEAGCDWAANHFCPRDELLDSSMAQFALVCTGGALLSKALFWSSFQRQLDRDGADPQATTVQATQLGAWMDMVFVVGSLVPTCWHLHELCGEADGDDKDAAVLGEIKAICNYFSRISFAVGVTDQAFLVEGAAAVLICDFAAASMEAAMAAVVS